MMPDSYALLQAILPHLDRGGSPDDRWPTHDGEYWALCPFHTDTKPTNFSVNDKAYNCFACGEKGGLRKLAKHFGIEIVEEERGGSLTLAEYAEAKHLPVDFLQRLGVKETKSRAGQPYITFTYRDEYGKTLDPRFRFSMQDKPKSRKGGKQALYGLWRLPMIRQLGWVLIVEGESDAQTAWLAGVPALGIPGASSWKPEWAPLFDRLDVYVWQEPDTGGDTLISHLRHALPAGHVLAAPAGVKDISAAHITGQDVAALIADLKASATPLCGDAEKMLPEIVVSGRPLRDTTGDTLNALLRANEPDEYVFVRSGSLVRVVSDENGEPVIDTLSESAMRGRVARCAEYIRISKEGDESITHPPLDVVRDLMGLGTWPFPALAGVVETPIVTPSGSLVTTPGYNAESRLIYMANGTRPGDIPTEPTPESIKAASALLLEIIEDFPFEDDASRANTLAAMFTPVVRPLIVGPTPLVLLDKPQAGTGASLLAELIALIATGRPSTMLSAPSNDEEWEKRITAILCQGRTVITIDNVDGLLCSPPLASALTSTVWGGRILGQTQMVSLPQRATWIATGNNIRLGGDLPRRCYWVRMDAKSPRPWQRGGFHHKNLLEWVHDERGRILTAMLTLVRAWIAAGRPAPRDLPIMGSYESWTRSIGGILHTANVAGFLGNIEAMYEQSDDETPQWEGFLVAWHACFSDRPVTVKEVIAGAAQSDVLKDAIPDTVIDGRTKEISAKSLGKALAKRNGMRYMNGLTIRKTGTAQRAVVWRVSTASPVKSVQSTFYNDTSWMDAIETLESGENDSE